MVQDLPVWRRMGEQEVPPRNDGPPRRFAARWMPAGTWVARSRATREPVRAPVIGRTDGAPAHPVRDYADFAIFRWSQSISTRFVSSGFSCCVQWPQSATVYFSRSSMKSSIPSAEEGLRMTSFSAPM